VLFRNNTFNRVSYYTMQDHLVLQSSEEVARNTTSTTVVVRDPHPGLQHIFTVKSVMLTQSTTYEGLEASVVFGQFHVASVTSLCMLYDHNFQLFTAYAHT